MVIFWKFIENLYITKLMFSHLIDYIKEHMMIEFSENWIE